MVRPRARPDGPQKPSHCDATRAAALGGSGVPEPTRRKMQAIRRRDTGPELAVRRALFARGLRYRVDHPIRCDDGRPIRPDLAFTRARVAVFVDGCFWHGCPDHYVRPRRNSPYWDRKALANRERDRRSSERLESAGWLVLRFWEHEGSESIAVAVEEALATRIATGAPECPRGKIQSA